MGMYIKNMFRALLIVVPLFVLAYGFFIYGEKFVETEPSATRLATKHQAGLFNESKVAALPQLADTYIFPLKQYNYISAVFGQPRSATLHMGVDFAADVNTEILACADGYVVPTEFSDEHGNYVLLNHANGTSTLYAHMVQKVAVAGTYVKQGDVIGYVGTTGNSLGDHLHLEMMVHGIHVNPLEYIPLVEGTWPVMLDENYELVPKPTAEAQPVTPTAIPATQ